MTDQYGDDRDRIQDVDYVVIGGGIHGAAVCFELAHGGAEVVLLERKSVASGASGGPGKRGVRANGRDPRELPLMRLAYDLWPCLADVLGAETGYERLGGLELIEASTTDDPLGWDAVLAQVQVQQAHGIATQVLDRAEVLRIEPGVGPLVQAAIHCPLDGVADHTATTHAYAAAASKSGAQVREGAEVSDLHPDGEHTITETAGGARFQARSATLVLTNSYAPALLAHSFGLQLPTWRLTPQITAVEPADNFRLNHLIGHRSRLLAAKAVDGGSVLLSGGRRGRWDDDYDVGVIDPQVPEASRSDATAVFPAFRDAAILDTDASRPESCSVDDIPIIDRVPGTDDAYFATGWSGHGFAIAPAVARLLVSWVRGRERPHQLEPFSLGRLGL